MIEATIGGNRVKISAYKTFRTESATIMGIKSAEIGEKQNKKVLSIAKDINKLMNEVASDSKHSPNINVFWLKNTNEKETLFLQIPLINNDPQKTNPSLAIALQTDPTTRSLIYELLTNPGTTQDAIKEYLVELLKPGEISIDPNQIDATKLVTFPQAFKLASQLARLSEDEGKKAEEIKKSFKNQVHLNNILASTNKSSVVEDSTPLIPTLAKKTKELQRKENENIKKVETEDEEALQIIDNTINDRRVRGKYRGGLIIHGKQFSPETYNVNTTRDVDYELLPLIEKYPGNWEEEIGYLRFRNMIDPIQQLFTFGEVISKDNTDRLQEVSPQGINFQESLNIIHFKDANDLKKTWIAILAPNTQRDASSRRTHFAMLFCSIPTNNLENLLNLINKNLDNAERFIQITFAGIDDNIMRPTGRIPLNKVAIIDLEKYLPKSLFETEAQGKNRVNKGFHDQFMSDLKIKGILDINSKDSITIKEYSQEYP